MPVDLYNPVARIAVVTDIHAYGSVKNSKDSLVDLSETSPHAINPLTDLINEVKKRAVTATALVCAGDICNMADYTGLQRAWGHLHTLKDVLETSHLIPTCGNHDLDSRYLSSDPDPDPKGGLLALRPSFPFQDEALTNKYWARNFAIVRPHPNVQIATLNTSAYHGGEQVEIEYGRVSTRTIEALCSELSSTERARINILVCHHHPLPLSGWQRGAVDGEFVKNGQDLLDALIQATGQSWLVIHGHRHQPRLIAGASSSNALPYIFGAGSLGARAPGVSNQFHLVSLYDSADAQHSSIVGTIETWHWTDSSRWSQIADGKGLPPLCGFGYRGQIGILADEITAHVAGTFAAWSDVIKSLPSVNLLMPDDMKRLEEELKKRGLELLFTRAGNIRQVGS